ncbi:MAG TPA: universal stress protein [Solirubrobacteraceae bacterium]|nr:universal stress protein [Solirubrobacteraceae bacterium]
MPGPLLFCYDGSEGSRAAMVAAAQLVAHPAPSVVLTIWQPAAVLLALAGGFGGGYLSDEGEVDAKQAQSAADAAEEGVQRAREHGYDASARVEEVTGAAGARIIEIADELDARLIVCGRRGRGTVASALLGSVSHMVLAHAGRPVLIAPER